MVEKEKWIKSAIRRKGALTATLIRKGRMSKGSKRIPSKALNWAKKQPGRLGRQANLSLTMRKF